MPMNFPKIIHQTYKDENIPSHWEKSQYMWKKLHPEYEYMFWTDKGIRSYIKQNYPDFLKLHDSYKYNIQRADMIRYFILYDFGGIYSDLDIYPIKNIEPYLTEDISDADVLLVNSGNISSCLTNSFMISKKKAPVWKAVHQQLKQKIPFYAVLKHLTVMYSTGPMMLTKVFSKHTSSFKLLPSEQFMAYSSNDDFTIVKKNAILMPLKGKSWNGMDSHVLNFLNENKTELIDSLIFYLMGDDKIKMKDALSKSIIDQTTVNDSYITFYVKNISSEYITNLNNIDYIKIEYDSNDKNVKIILNHRDSDGCKLMFDISGKKIGKDNTDVNEIEMFIYTPLKSSRLMKTYVRNKFFKPPFLNHKNGILQYNNFHLPFPTMKQKMSACGYTHTSSFLFALNVYAFWKKTNATYVKCKNIYYIPFIVGKNKILDYTFFVTIKKDDDNVFKNIYTQIKDNNKSIDEIWGMNVLLNLSYLMYQNMIDTINQNKKSLNTSTTSESDTDVTFSNIPIKMDMDDLKITNKERQPEKLYCFCIGNKTDDIIFSLVYDESLDGVPIIIKEIFDTFV
jgi:mannosyltransferase OCH1-like enzyme